MDNIFSIVDKTGRKIRLTKTQYGHVIRHKGIEHYIEEIKQTLVKPLKIIRREEGSLYDYYTHNKHRLSPFKYLKVVVKYLNGEGFVITAYFVKNMN
ncbi:MAG: hypothetical protein AABX29_08015 [Nanoarchaeota archaeon]